MRPKGRLLLADLSEADAARYAANSFPFTRGGESFLIMRPRAPRERSYWLEWLIRRQQLCNKGSASVVTRVELVTTVRESYCA
jgi:hypothetical protein